MKPERKHLSRKEADITRGSGNVFADLGFNPRQASELAVKAELSRRIFHRIKELRLNQTQAGQRLGISQPDVSRLLNGKFTGYSTDRLIGLLNLLEVDVDIVIRPRKNNPRHRPGVLRVREAANAA